MASFLTRRVFRCIITNEPIIFRCPRSAHTIRPRNAFIPRRRTFFGLSRTPKRKEKEARQAVVDPGITDMLDLMMSDKLLGRPPAPEVLAKAWNSFFKNKFDQVESVNNYQARYALRTFKHLQKMDEERKEGKKHLLSVRNMTVALTALNNMPNDMLDTHTELGTQLMEEVQRRFGPNPKAPAAATPGEADPSNMKKPLCYYITLLSRTGHSERARDIVMPQLLEYLDGKENAPVRTSIIAIMNGFAAEDNEEQLLRTYDANADSVLILVIVKYYADKDNVGETKKWFSRFEKHGFGKEKHEDAMYRNTTLLTSLLKFSVRKNQQEWINAVFKNVIERGPKKHQWDVIFQWAAGSMGKGVEDVKRMMEVMIRHGETPDADTINGLVSLAMSLKDPYLAERYINMGRKFDIYPNAETYLLQLDYRLSAGDLTGANASYEALQSEEVIKKADIPVINKYIRALCAAPVPDTDLILDLSDSLDKRGARLEPSTVIALSKFHLARQEPNSMLDVIQAHCFMYNELERREVIDACLAHTLDPEIATVEAWECYQIFAHCFQETSIPRRTKVMQEFFRRKRSDMALHVFGHMRAHDSETCRPTMDTYVQCFEGIADCRDKPSLDTVHNMLKMDVTIEPSTVLYNSLLRAYTECGDPYKSIRFWTDITNSREGPNYRSLELVFRALQKTPFGDKQAGEIWNKMRRMNIEVTRAVFIAYVGCLAGQGLLEDAKALVESGEQDFGLVPDMMTIGHLYNALPGQNRKDLVATWCEELYPSVWSQLQACGQQEMKEGHMLFKLPGIENVDEDDDEEDEDADILS